MTYTIDDGVLGLEGLHSILYDGEWQFTMQGQRFPNGLPYGTPVIKIDKITGIHSLAEGEDNRLNAESRQGELPYPSLTRGKTITYEGRIIAYSLRDLRKVTNAMRAKAQRLRYTGDIGGIEVKPHPDYIGGGDNGAFFTTARVMALDIDEQQVRGRNAQPSPWQREFIFSLRQNDPRWKWFPLAQQFFIGGSGQVTNRGNAPAEPTFLVAGPVNDLTIHNVETGKQLVFHDLNIPLGKKFFVNFEQRSAGMPTNPNGLSPNVLKLGNLVSNVSSWWDSDQELQGLHPGVNNLLVYGDHPIIGWAVGWAHTSY